MLTDSVTVVPVCKSAGNCPVKFVFRDVTEVKLLTFMLWVFISNILREIFSSFSPPAHFHLHLFLSPSTLYEAWLWLAWWVHEPRLQKQHQWALCLCSPCRNTLNHFHFLLQIMPMAYILQPHHFVNSLKICLENQQYFQPRKKMFYKYTDYVFLNHWHDKFCKQAHLKARLPGKHADGTLSVVFAGCFIGSYFCRKQPASVFCPQFST